MFKKFSADKDIGTNNLLRSSTQRDIRQKIVAQFPRLQHDKDLLEEIIPKKADLVVGKCTHDRVSLFSVDGQVIFFQRFDGPFLPSLRVLHKYPDLLTFVKVDAGAIKHVLQGADIMCPGLTSPGGYIPPDLDVDQVVAIMAEDKQHALAVGIAAMNASEILQVNQGIAIQNAHYLNDGLWKAIITNVQ